MSGLLFEARTRTKEVKIDEVQFQSFHGSTTAIGTRDLRSCSVVLVASRMGAILAHIAPRGDAHAAQMMDRFMQIYQEQKKVYFPSENETWVVMGMIDQGGQLEMGLEGQKKVIDSKLTGMGLGDRKNATYKFKLQPAATSPTFPGKGTVFVDGKGPKPIVYVEDKAVS